MRHRGHWGHMKKKKQKEMVLKIRYKSPDTRLKWDKLVAVLKYLGKAENFEEALNYLMQLDLKTREIEAEAVF